MALVNRTIGVMSKVAITEEAEREKTTEMNHGRTLNPHTSL